MIIFGDKHPNRLQMDYACYTVLNTVTGYLGQDQVQHEQRQQAGGGQQVGHKQVQDEAATTSGNFRAIPLHCFL